MEKRKVLVGDFVKKVAVERRGNILVIGETPQLVVDLKNQKNYIKVENKKIPYYREVALSEDLLSGKREKVFEIAINHYYKQACNVVEGMQFVERYFSKMNTTIRELK